MTKKVANTVAYVVYDDKGVERAAGWSAQDAWEGIDFEEVEWSIGNAGAKEHFTQENIAEAQNRGWRCIVHDLVAQEDGPPWDGENNEGHGQ